MTVNLILQKSNRGHTMKMINKLILLFGIIFSNNILAGTIDPKTEDLKYIEFGKKFNYVYQICGSYDDGSLFCASAVAIDPHWVLTAAHVVNGAKICIVHQNDKAFLVHKIISHENFHKGKFGNCDIALCYLDEDLGLDFYPELYDTNDEVGKTCTISGYGFTGTFATGAKLSDGNKRAGSNKIDYIDKDLLICTPSLLNKTELEFIIANGDSGGGLFIGNKLAGINSCVLAIDKIPDSTYSDEGGHTRISKFIPWITQAIKTKKPTIKSVLGVDKSTGTE
jgi:hypothetical protein